MNRILVYALLSTILSSSVAYGQSNRAVQAEGFEPTATQHTDVLHVQGSQVLGHLQPSFGAFGQFVDDAVQIRRLSDDRIARILDDQYKLDLSAAIGLWDIVDLGVVLPITVYQTSDAVNFGGLQQEPLPSFAFSDIRLVPRLQILNAENAGGFGLGVATTVYIPTGDDTAFHSDGEFRAEPKLLLDWRNDAFLLSANAGYQLRPETQIRNFGSSDTIRFGVGAEWEFVDQWALQANFIGGVSLGEGRDPNDLTSVASNDVGRPMEAIGAIRYAFLNGTMIQVGGGAGLTNGIGAPDARAFLSIFHSPLTSSASKQAIAIASGEEIFVDTDGDGVLEDDECPDDFEDPDGFEDEDGCPDPDNDGDGILDVSDACLNEAGIAEKEGCPFVDTDGDGLDDDDDTCPKEAEDKDGFNDDDGCPDLDNDNDGIPDTTDKCPLKPETINGVEDDDGCPDIGDSKVSVTNDAIEILEAIYFDSGKATIKSESFGILDQVASVLKSSQRIKRIEIQGHTDSKGDTAKNQDLSQRRALAVKEYLVAKGVAADRLTSKGYGEMRPIADNVNKRGRAYNRRVEFLILDVADK